MALLEKMAINIIGIKAVKNISTKTYISSNPNGKSVAKT